MGGDVACDQGINGPNTLTVGADCVLHHRCKSLPTWSGNGPYRWRSNLPDTQVLLEFACQTLHCSSTASVLEPQAVHTDKECTQYDRCLMHSPLRSMPQTGHLRDNSV